MDSAYKDLLAEVAEAVDEALAGIARTETTGTIRLDPQKVRERAANLIATFVKRWRGHHHAEASSAESEDIDSVEPSPTNPMNWPTPEGRKAIQDDDRMACYCATAWSIHDCIKDESVHVEGWPLARAILYGFIREQREGYDHGVVREALRNVKADLIERCRATSPTVAGPELTDFQMTVFMEIAESPVLLTQSDLIKRLPGRGSDHHPDPKTVRAAIKALEDRQLIDYPPGKKRGGLSLTEKGRELGRVLDQSSK